MEIPRVKPWKIAENRTLKWGSSPLPSRGGNHACSSLQQLLRPFDRFRTQKSVFPSSCPGRSLGRNQRRKKRRGNFQNEQVRLSSRKRIVLSAPRLCAMGIDEMEEASITPSVR